MKYLAYAMNLVWLAVVAYELIEKGIPDNVDEFLFVAVIVILPVVNMIALSAKDDDESILSLWLEVKKKNLRKQLSDDR